MKKTLILLIAALLISSSAAATAARAQISPGDAAAKEDLRKTNNEIARLYGQKKYDEALPQAQKAVALTEQIFGKSHLETARALRNL
ncbi:MAG TPA: tetratricopeptide repeat protein, partial [Pyrinomonadaceae bacterium]|nr:tetratricopeptide repeat protein [Pyrinomonadaceae bacterium]